MLDPTYYSMTPVVEHKLLNEFSLPSQSGILRDVLMLNMEW